MRGRGDLCKEARRARSERLREEVLKRGRRQQGKVEAAVVCCRESLLEVGHGAYWMARSFLGECQNGCEGVGGNATPTGPEVSQALGSKGRPGQ